MKQHYVNSKELELIWSEYNKTKDPDLYEKLCLLIYKIAEGVSRKFYPPNDEEHQELTNQAYLMAIDKINRGVLKFKPGKASVFNLVTTAVYNLLYSYKTSEKRKTEKIKKYALKKYNIGDQDA
jgi:hypothetical protein